ncbi:hypothetical protein JXC34_04305 [Candidatus Woesearchaeota archaeon]|nr:hypothetical protein [Candidatus Woesearchaeota archaeon]
METYRAYRRTKDHISKHGIVDLRYELKLSEWYCTQVGFRLAVKESGLENLLE